MTHLKPEVEFPLLSGERVPFMREGCELMQHQIYGLSFGVHREQNPVHGVAGGMFLYRQGLGKTPMTLALVARDASRERLADEAVYLRGVHIAATLVVVCKSVLGTWKEEFHKFFGDQPGFRHLVFHRSEFEGGGGGLGARLGTSYRDFGVRHLRRERPLLIVTTYETVRIGAEQYEKARDEKRTLEQIHGPALLHALYWRRKVADESQRFANDGARLGRAVRKLRAKFSWCLTGTPIRNHYRDLEPQLEFVGVSRELDDASCESIMRRVVLHLDYPDADVSMPDLRIRTVRVCMDPEERLVYDHYLGATRRALKLYDAAARNSVHFFAVLTQLRIACVSTHLLCVGRAKDGRDKLQREHLQRQKKQMSISDFFGDRSPSPPAAAPPPPAPEEPAAKQPSSPLQLVRKPKIRVLDLQQVQQLDRRKRNLMKWNVRQATTTTTTTKGIVVPSPVPCRVEEDEEEEPLSEDVLPSPVKHEEEQEEELSNMQQIFDQLPEASRAFVSLRGRDSSKMREIRRIVQEHVGADEKFIVFSNFASALPLIHEALLRDGVKTLSICGKIRRRERDSIRMQFDQDPSIRGLLLTYGAGGLGLTLVAANHVVMADPWWGGERENQAMARAYRIGQRRIVHVYRLLVADSVEVRMREVASRKEDELETFLGVHRARKVKRQKKQLAGRELAIALVG